MAEHPKVTIADAREKALDYKAGLWRATADRSLFHFAQDRTLTDPAVLAGCTFADIYFSHRVSWGAPHPGVFRDFFPQLLSPLLPEGLILILTLTGMEPKDFDEAQFIEQELLPRKLDSFWLGPSASRSHQVEFKTLLFEWPRAELATIVDLGFKGFLVQFEGYILEARSKQVLRELFERPNNDLMFRELLRHLPFSFRVWSDNNGLFLATDRLAIQELAKRLEIDKLERDLGAVIHLYES